MQYLLGLALLAYLLGSIPTGVLVARYLGGPDPRRAGSGNLGTANLCRLMGFKAGALTFLGDVLKGALPVLLGCHFLGPVGPWRDGALALVGLSAVLGQVFPLYLGFKGGKGVATSFGVVAVLAPWAALSLALVYSLTLAWTRTFSLGTLVGTWFLPLAVGLFSRSPAHLLLAGALSALILLRHRENLKRLVMGDEPHF